ncbi:hypothetical protein B0H10DRAFT_761453 [Mycena sp. CBHHK59/15]|nr:hypothetical protein B0H10DRAFT_761453 [Mycena sp. CBHHK59/15]
MKSRGELGWLCLTSCGSDVIFNACALFWVTRTYSTNSSTVERDHRPGPNSMILSIVSSSHLRSATQGKDESTPWVVGSNGILKMQSLRDELASRDPPEIQILVDPRPWPEPMRLQEILNRSQRKMAHRALSPALVCF